MVARLLADGWRVVGIDNVDDFYDSRLKRATIEANQAGPGFEFHQADIRDLDQLIDLLDRSGAEVVVHLAAMAGVGPSAERPHLYHDVNVNGTASLLEAMSRTGIDHLVFASSSSIYGDNPNVPWHEHDRLQPISVYAETKVVGEALVAAWAHQGTNTAVATRLFTVFGPGQRPDLAITNFAAKMLNGQPIQIHGDGSVRRDFTHVDDIVSGLLAAVDLRLEPFVAVNLARGEPVGLMEVVDALQESLGVEAEVNYGQPVVGDVSQTWGSIERAARLLGYRPSTDLVAGLAAARPWFERVAALMAETQPQAVNR